MKRTPSFFLFVLLLAALPVRAQTDAAAEAFAVGNAQYMQGDYRAALAAYERALETGLASGALYYNMGNAYYRLDELGRAVLHYERARRLLPDRPEVLHNLEMARARTVDRFAARPVPVWTRAWRGVVRGVGAWGLFGAGLALYLAAAGLVAHRIWAGTRGDWHRRALAVTLAAGLVLLGAAFFASNDRTDRAAVVLVDVAPLYETPADDAEGSVEVHEGATVDVLRAAGAWVEVRLPNGVRGWLPADAVARV